MKISSNVGLPKRELTNVNFSKVGYNCILPLCKWRMLDHLSLLHNCL